MRYLLDTNTLSALVSNPEGIVYRRMQQAGAENLCTSIMVAAELRFGIALRGSAQLTAAVEGILRRLDVVPFESPADRIYGALRAELRRRGTPIGGNDLFIAAHALALDCRLVTDNAREFERVDGLQVENWLRVDS